MALVQNWPFPPSFYFRKYILERENTFQGEKLKKLKETKNWDFSKGFSPWFWSKSRRFFHLLILGNVDWKNVSYDILQRTIAFLGYQIKNLISKSRKIEVCPKGFVHGFGPKLTIFSIALF